MCESSDLCLISYKDLQTMAKQSGIIPANMQRKFLIQALLAHRDGDNQLVNEIVILYKTSRKRRVANRPQNLCISKKRKKTSKCKNKDETFVDSTSNEIKDLVPLNSTSLSILNSDKSSTPDRFSFLNKIYSNSNQQYDVPQFNSLSIANDNRYNGNYVNNYDHQFSFKNSFTTSTPFDRTKYSSQVSLEKYSPSVQSLMQQYLQPDSASANLSYYNCGEGYRANPYSQYTTYNCDVIGANNCGTENYPQLPNISKNSCMSMTKSTSDKNYMNLCSSSTSKCSYYTKDGNDNIPPMEIDCPSHLLPNIPQLDTQAENNLVPTSSCVTWTQDAELVSNEAGRMRATCEAQIQNDVVVSQGTNVRPPSGSTSAHTGSGKYSEEDALSLNEEIANILELNKDEQRKSNVGGYDMNNEADCAYVNDATNNYLLQVGTSGNTMDDGCIKNSAFAAASNALSCFNNYSFLDNNNSVGSSHAPLPSISTLFNGLHQAPENSQQDPHPTSSRFYSCSLSYPDTTYPLFKQGSDDSYSQYYSSSNSQNCIRDEDIVDLNTPNTSPARNYSGESILRNHLQGGESFTMKQSVQEDKTNLNLVEDKKEEKENVKTEISRVIYKSETLHRSKIICNLVKEEALKEESVQKLVQIYEYTGIPNDKYPDLKPISMIKTLEKESIKETALSMLPLRRPCCFKKQGCNMVLSQEFVNRHEKKCTFQPICCPSDMCSWYNSMNLLTRHICEYHREEIIQGRNQYVYLVDRKKWNSRAFYTYYQLYEDVIYVVRIHIEQDKCVALLQYVQEVKSIIREEKQGMMQMVAFCNKLRVKTWNGVVQPYCVDENQHLDGAIQLNIRNTDFIGLRLVIS